MLSVPNYTLTHKQAYRAIFQHTAQEVLGHREGLYWQSLTLDMQDSFNTLRPRQNGRRFPDDIFKCIFLNENARISIKISLKFVPKGPINNIPALVQIMAWRQPGDKP